MTKKYILNLNCIGKEDIKIAGGKAASLGEMIKSGLDVPEGFVVHTDAYKKFIKDNSIESKIKLLLQSDAVNAKKINEISAKIKSLFYEANIPNDISNEIKDSYKELTQSHGHAVVVRSSATVEDLPGASFAGQYSTFLNVIGEVDLIDHVVKCWASLWNSQAISYRFKQGISNDNISHGVIVQKLIDAKKSGIIFTANPVNNRRDQVLINASWGLGEAIVGGEVNPDEWVLDKNNGKIVKEQIANKEIMAVRRNKGISLVSVHENDRLAPTLNREEVFLLYRLAINAENYFNEPQDIEWAFIEGKAYLVQSRPITSLYPLPKKNPKKPGVRIYLNMNSYSQAMKEPFTPMGEDLIYRAIQNTRKALGPKKISNDSLWYLSTAGGRMFVDITAFLRKESFWKKFRNVDYTDKDPVTTKALLEFLENNRDEILGHKERVSYLKILNIRLIRYGWKIWREFVFGKKYPAEARERAKNNGRKFIADLKQKCASLNSSYEKIEFIKKEIHLVFMAGAETLFYVASSSTAISKVKKMMEKYLGDSKDLYLVEKAVPYSVTTEMGIELMKLASYYYNKKTLPSDEDVEITDFLERFGHKKSVELDVGVPTWSEDTSYVISLIQSYMEKAYFEKALKEFEINKSVAVDTIKSIKNRFLEKGYNRNAHEVERLLKGFREMFGVREESKFVITQGLQLVRFLLLDIGKELFQQGKLEDTQDIFFLKIDDLVSSENLKSIVATNKQIFENNKKINAPRLMTSSGEALYNAYEENTSDTLTGIPVSTGVFEGYARVLEKPEDGYKLNKNDILVTAGTNPAWTPLFLKIGGLVMEYGGSISHGSVVAREYGLPAVSGITNATTIIKTGQKIRINGESGTVKILEESLD